MIGLLVPSASGGRAAGGAAGTRLGLACLTVAVALAVTVPVPVGAAREHLRDLLADTLPGPELVVDLVHPGNALGDVLGQALLAPILHGTGEGHLTALDDH